MSRRSTIVGLRLAGYAALLATVLVAIAYRSWWLVGGVVVTLLAVAAWAAAAWLEEDDRRRYAERLRRLE